MFSDLFNSLEYPNIIEEPYNTDELEEPDDTDELEESDDTYELKQKKFDKFIKTIKDEPYKQLLITKFKKFLKQTIKNAKLSDLIDCFILTLHEAAIVLASCTTMLKRILREYKIERWPGRDIKAYCKHHYKDTSYVDVIKQNNFLQMCKQKQYINDVSTFTSEHISIPSKPLVVRQKSNTRQPNNTKEQPENVAQLDADQQFKTLKQMQSQSEEQNRIKEQQFEIFLSEIKEEIEEAELNLYNSMIQEIKSLNEVIEETNKQNYMLNIMAYNTKRQNKKLEEEINRRNIQ